MEINKWVAVGAMVLGVGVVLGAFGAHGLKSRVSPEMMEIWEKAVSYQMYHGYILILLPVLSRLQFIPEFSVQRLCAVFLFGIVVFSGSLYLLAFSGIRWLGAITPIGGMSFIVGWMMLTYRLLR